MPDLQTQQPVQQGQQDINQSEGLQNEVSKLGSALDNYYKKQDAIASANQYAHDFLKGAGQYGTYDVGYEPNRYKEYDWDRELFDRYGFNPLRDNEAIYQSASSGWTDVARGMRGGAKLASDVFVDVLPWNAYDDTVDAVMADKSSMYNTIYGSRRGGVAGFTGNLFVNGGFALGVIAESFIENMVITGLTAGLGTAAGALGTGVKFASLAKQFANINNALRQTSKTIRFLDEMNDASRIGAKLGVVGKQAVNFVNPFEHVANNLSSIRKMNNLNAAQKGVMIASDLTRDITAFGKVMSESSMEGGTVLNDALKNMTDDFQKEYGRAPSDIELANMKTVAMNEANRTFWLNVPAIFLSNKINLSGITRGFKLPDVPNDYVFHGPNAMKKAMSGLKIDAVTRRGPWNPWSGFKDNWLASPQQTLAKTLTAIGEGTTEGLQEVYQEAVSSGATKYAEDSYFAKVGSFYSCFLNGAQLQLSSQGLETFLSGFLMGPAMSVASGSVSTIEGATKSRRNDGTFDLTTAGGRLGNIMDDAFGFVFSKESKEDYIKKKRDAEKRSNGYVNVRDSEKVITRDEYKKLSEDERKEYISGYDASINDDIEMLNELSSDPNKFMEGLDNIIDAVNSIIDDDSLDEDQKAGNIKRFYDKQHYTNRKYALAILRSGMMDSYIGALQDQKNITDEKFKEMSSSDPRFSSMKKEEYIRHLDNQISSLEGAKDAYVTINKTVTNEYKEQAIAAKNAMIEAKKKKDFNALKEAGKNFIIATGKARAKDAAIEQAIFMRLESQDKLRRAKSVLNDALDMNMGKVSFGSVSDLFDTHGLFSDTTIEGGLDKTISELESYIDSVEETEVLTDDLKAEYEKRKELLPVLKELQETLNELDRRSEGVEDKQQDQTTATSKEVDIQIAANPVMVEYNGVKFKAIRDEKLGIIMFLTIDGVSIPFVSVPEDGLQNRWIAYKSITANSEGSLELGDVVASGAFAERAEEISIALYQLYGNGSDIVETVDVSEFTKDNMQQLFSENSDTFESSSRIRNWNAFSTLEKGTIMKRSINGSAPILYKVLESMGDGSYALQNLETGVAEVYDDLDKAQDFVVERKATKADLYRNFSDEELSYKIAELTRDYLIKNGVREDEISDMFIQRVIDYHQLHADEKRISRNAKVFAGLDSERENIERVGGEYAYLYENRKAFFAKVFGAMRKQDISGACYEELADNNFALNKENIGRLNNFGYLPKTIYYKDESGEVVELDEDSEEYGTAISIIRKYFPNAVFQFEHIIEESSGMEHIVRKGKRDFEQEYKGCNTIEDYLNAMIKNEKALKKEKELAKILLEKLDEQAKKISIGLNTSRMQVVSGNGKSIELNPLYFSKDHMRKPYDIEKVLLKCVVMATTFTEMNDESSKLGSKLTEFSDAIYRKLSSIAHSDKREDIETTTYLLGLFNSTGRGWHMLSRYEIIANALVNPKFQEFLANFSMSELGMDIKKENLYKPSSAWEGFLGIIKQIIKKVLKGRNSPTYKKVNGLDYIMSLATEFYDRYGDKVQSVPTEKKGGKLDKENAKAQEEAQEEKAIQKDLEKKKEKESEDLPTELSSVDIETQLKDFQSFSVETKDYMLFQRWLFSPTMGIDSLVAGGNVFFVLAQLDKMLELGQKEYTGKEPSVKKMLSFVESLIEQQRVVGKMSLHIEESDQKKLTRDYKEKRTMKEVIFLCQALGISIDQYMSYKKERFDAHIHFTISNNTSDRTAEDARLHSQAQQRKIQLSNVVVDVKLDDESEPIRLEHTLSDLITAIENETDEAKKEELEKEADAQLLYLAGVIDGDVEESHDVVDKEGRVLDTEMFAKEDEISDIENLMNEHEDQCAN